MVDAADRAENVAIILDVLAAKGGDGRFLHAIAKRESGLNHAIRHVLPGDRSGARKAWARNANRYRNNPYYDQVELWDHGKGLFGMLTAYHLHRWDPNAHPDSLFNPYVASVAAARLTRGCMLAGAQTWADVDQCWATGKPTRTASWDGRRERMMGRLQRLGYPPQLVDERPQPGDWGQGPQPDQLDVLWAIHGGPEPVEDPGTLADPTGVLVREDKRSAWPWVVLGLGVAGVGAAGYLAYQQGVARVG